ncbi:MAG: SIS domain-containing protein [Actinomycetota bacterium]
MTATGRATSGMAADMAEQPAVLSLLLARRDELIRAFRALAPEPFRGVVLVARGSSENAALFGRILLEAVTRRPASLAPPSLARLYHTRTAVEGYLAIGLSQSGRTHDVVSTLAALKRGGATTLALTADLLAPIVDVADHAVDLRTGPETTVPATKTFTAELAVLAMLAEALGDVPAPTLQWVRMVEAVAEELNDGNPVLRAVERLAGVTHLSVIGSGMMLGIAKEAALKITEASLIAASGWSASSFRHGPMALAGTDHPLIAIVGPGHAGDETRRTVSALADVPAIIIAGTGQRDISLPSGLPEPLTAIPAAVRAQQLALALALRRGVDPDRPPRLKKVTV